VSAVSAVRPERRVEVEHIAVVDADDRVRRAYALVLRAASVLPQAVPAPVVTDEVKRDAEHTRKSAYESRD